MTDRYWMIWFLLLLLVVTCVFLGYAVGLKQGNKTIASLKAERDSLKGMITRQFPADGKVRVIQTFHPDSIQFSWYMYDSLVLDYSIGSEKIFPDTLKTRPMRRDLPPSDAKP